MFEEARVIRTRASYVLYGRIGLQTTCPTVDFLSAGPTPHLEFSGRSERWASKAFSFSLR
jgi:hypothetical protein